MSPELKLLSTAVTECGSGSLFVHSTVVPTGTSMRGLRYARFLIPVRETRAGSARRGVGVGRRVGVAPGGAAAGAGVTGAARAAVSTGLTRGATESARALGGATATESTLGASRTVSTRTTVSGDAPSATEASTRFAKYLL